MCNKISAHRSVYVIYPIIQIRDPSSSVNNVGTLTFKSYFLLGVHYGHNEIFEPITYASVCIEPDENVYTVLYFWCSYIMGMVSASHHIWND